MLIRISEILTEGAKPTKGPKPKPEAKAKPAADAEDGDDAPKAAAKKPAKKPRRSQGQGKARCEGKEKVTLGPLRRRKLRRQASLRSDHQYL